MANRKAPRQIDRNQVKPPAPPAPPRRIKKIDLTFRDVFSSAFIVNDGAEMVCNSCRTTVPPNVIHECEVNGGVRTVRNRPT